MLSDEDAQVLIDLADKLRAAGAGAGEAEAEEMEDELGGEELPLPTDDLGGEEEDAMALEGKEKDLEEKKDLDEEKEDLEEKKSTDDLVSEIAKRVAARILLEK